MPFKGSIETGINIEIVLQSNGPIHSDPENSLQDIDDLKTAFDGIDFHFACK